MKIKVYYSFSLSLIHKVIFENNMLTAVPENMDFFSFLNTISQFLLEFDSNNLDSHVLLSPQFFKMKNLVTRINILLSMKSAQTLPLERLNQCILVAMEK